MNINRLITIVGPTAVGKTDISIQLGQLYGTHIISGDAYQAYRHLNIGTAKPSLQEQSLVPHHLIDFLNPHDHYCVATFKRLSSEIIAKENEAGRIPILSGGTGLYVQALLEDYQFSVKGPDHNLRKELDDMVNTKGMEALIRYGTELAAEEGISLVHLDKHRLYRAIELLRSGNGKALEEQQKKGLSYDGPVIGLMRSREELYERINKRVDHMIEAGLIEEVRALLAEGIRPDAQSMKGIGYKEVVLFIQGKIGEDDCIELIKKNTRHFAKRQITWYKRMPYIEWIYVDESKSADDVFEETQQLIASYFENGSNNE